jgi:hypothetical protein
MKLLASSASQFLKDGKILATIDRPVASMVMIFDAGYKISAAKDRTNRPFHIRSAFRDCLRLFPVPFVTGRIADALNQGAIERSNNNDRSRITFERRTRLYPPGLMPAPSTIVI